VGVAVANVEQAAQQVSQDNDDFSPVEREVIALKAIADMLNALVNHELLILQGPPPKLEVVFKDLVHQRLFGILLADFLTRPKKPRFGLEGSYLDVLAGICDDPKLLGGGAVGDLAAATQRANEWLDAKINVPAWFPTIEREVPDFAIRRREIVIITGNISKHGFAGLTGVARRLVRILGKNGVEIDRHQAISILNEFYERFHDDVLAAHATALVELLNRVRWGMHRALLPVFQLHYRRDPDHELRYWYEFPDGVERAFAQGCFWELMNKARQPPYVDPFEALWNVEGHYRVIAGS
jgi:hypothetical protein